ncbi:MAG: rRNA maturation RNase YbeY [Candidatus Omnitrophota bacterium]|nr:rRNA maturation RNase YbeY [Candidatus Omnitrophota bacterium]
MITIINLQEKIPVCPKKIKKAASKIFSLTGKSLSKDQITICFTTDKTVKKLNLKYLHSNTSTDVLVFDLTEKISRYMIADIIISAEKAIHNAKIFKTTPAYELFLYLTHGILHLLGYDDKTKKQRERMHKQEKDILEILGVKVSH